MHFLAPCLGRYSLNGILSREIPCLRKFLSSYCMQMCQALRSKYVFAIQINFTYGV